MRRIAASWRAKDPQRSDGDGDWSWTSRIMVTLGLLAGAFMLYNMYETHYPPSEQPLVIDARAH